MKDAAKHIEENLYDLYLKCTIAGCIRKYVGSCKAIIADNSAWPNYVYGPLFSEKITENLVDEVVGKMKSMDLPPFWIRQNTSSNNEPEIPSGKGLRLIMRWPGMIADLKKETNAGIDDKIRTVKKPEELAQWDSIVNKTLFTKPALDIKISLSLALTDSTTLYIAFHNKLPAGTLLASYHNKNVGFYMISTLPEFRKQGIASSLIRKAMSDALHKGCSHAVLQANKESAGLYASLGFRKISDFDIYWLVSV
jgi:GNAT superfamily N-acetyltransferase